MQELDNHDKSEKYTYEYADTVFSVYPIYKEGGEPILAILQTLIKDDDEIN